MTDKPISRNRLLSYLNNMEKEWLEEYNRHIKSGADHEYMANFCEGHLSAVKMIRQDIAAIDTRQSIL